MDEEEKSHLIGSPSLAEETFSEESFELNTQFNQASGIRTTILIVLLTISLAANIILAWTTLASSSTTVKCVERESGVSKYG